MAMAGLRGLDLFELFWYFKLPTEQLDSDEAIAVYLDEAVLTQASSPAPSASPPAPAVIAKDAGLSRESLYKALSGSRNPEFATVLRVLQALGVRMGAVGVG